jgi:hypothetical protein
MYNPNAFQPIRSCYCHGPSESMSKSYIFAHRNSSNPKPKKSGDLHNENAYATMVMIAHVNAPYVIHTHCNRMEKLTLFKAEPKQHRCVGSKHVNGAVTFRARPKIAIVINRQTAPRDGIRRTKCTDRSSLAINNLHRNRQCDLNDLNEPNTQHSTSRKGFSRA